MCGICGFLSFDTPPDQTTIQRMNGTLVRRGPDGEGFYRDQQVALAMRRLAIIDLEGGWQPIYNEDRSLVVVFNGEIYNYRELRTRLESAGHHFATRSDTEVIVHLYEEHGTDFVLHLRGMFAVALWDMRRQQLVLARDRLGIKPLYIARTPLGLYFGSEIKAILASGAVPRDLDPQALDEYLAYTYIPAPRSIYRGIRKLMPATVLVVGADGSERSHRYWTLGAPVPEVRSENDWMEAMEAALKDAVRSHLVSDVPVGAFLSGGIDSGLVVAMMATQTSSPVRTFTVGFQDAGGAFIDERIYARSLAERYPLDHHEIDVTPDVARILPEIVQAFDEPFADDSVVPSYYVSQATAATVKVAMSGLGGDELFAGYRRHLGMRMGESYGRLPRLVRRNLLAPLVGRLPEFPAAGDRIDHLKRFVLSNELGPALRYQDFMSSLPEVERQSLIHPDLARGIGLETTREVMTTPFESAATSSVLEKSLRTDLAVYLPDDILTLSDRLSMWHSLELRVPFLDHPLVELAASIPPDLKIRGRLQKHLLRRVAYRWLPTPMIEHRKQGFEAPMGAWLKGPLRPMLEAMRASRRGPLDGLVSSNAVSRLIEQHLQGVRKNSKILFSLLVLDIWHRQGMG